MSRNSQSSTLLQLKVRYRVHLSQALFSVFQILKLQLFNRILKQSLGVMLSWKLFHYPL